MGCGPAAAYEVVLTLLDGRGVPQQTVVNPNPGFTVFSNLAAGQLLHDPYSVPLPPDAPAGYTVQLALRQPGTDSPLPISDASGSGTINIARLKTSCIRHHFGRQESRFWTTAPGL